MSRNVSNTESQETIDPCGYRVRVRVAIEGRHTESCKLLNLEHKNLDFIE